MLEFDQYKEEYEIHKGARQLARRYRNALWRRKQPSEYYYVGKDALKLIKNPEEDLERIIDLTKEIVDYHIRELDRYVNDLERNINELTLSDDVKKGIINNLNKIKRGVEEIKRLSDDILRYSFRIEGELKIISEILVGIKERLEHVEIQRSEERRKQKINMIIKVIQTVVGIIYLAVSLTGRLVLVINFLC